MSKTLGYAVFGYLEFLSFFQVTTEPEPKSDDDGAFNSDDDFGSIEQADKDDKKADEVNIYNEQ